MKTETYNTPANELIADAVTTWAQAHPAAFVVVLAIGLGLFIARYC